MEPLRKFKVAMVQHAHFLEKDRILENVEKQLEIAVKGEAKICLLPECFNTLYRADKLKENAEKFTLSDISSSKSLQFIRNQAQKHSIYLIDMKAEIGSLPEFDESNGKYYNTAFAFSPKGEFLAVHRKVHLFDIDIPGKMTYKESDTFGPGEKITVFDTEFCKIGLGICYDLRFPEMAQVMIKRGAKILVYPSLFSLVTGELHFELLVRARALDNQSFVFGVQAARFVEDPQYYQCWGHSTASNPMGKVIGTAGVGEEVVICEVDLDQLETNRRDLPYQIQKRPDLYEVVDKKL